MLCRQQLSELSHRHGVRLTNAIKSKICRHCSAFLVPGLTCRTRVVKVSELSQQVTAPVSRMSLE